MGTARDHKQERSGACTSDSMPWFALAGAGEGGGAAQLFPAELLGTIVCRAEAALVPGRPPDAALRTLFDGIQAEIAALTEGLIYRGSGAAAVAALCGSAEIHLTVTGLCRASRISGKGIVALTRDESLCEEARQAGLEAPDFIRDVITRRFGSPGAASRPWQVVSTPHLPGTAYLLST